MKEMRSNHWWKTCLLNFMQWIKHGLMPIWQKQLIMKWEKNIMLSWLNNLHLTSLQLMKIQMIFFLEKNIQSLKVWSMSKELQPMVDFTPTQQKKKMLGMLLLMESTLKLMGFQLLISQEWWILLTLSIWNYMRTDTLINFILK